MQIQSRHRNSPAIQTVRLEERHERIHARFATALPPLRFAARAFAFLAGAFELVQQVGQVGGSAFFIRIVALVADASFLAVALWFVCRFPRRIAACTARAFSLAGAFPLVWIRAWLALAYAFAVAWVSAENVRRTSFGRIRARVAFALALAVARRRRFRHR